MTDGMVQFNALEGADFARRTALAQIESLQETLADMRLALQEGFEAERLEAAMDELILNTHQIVLALGIQANFEELLK